MNKELREKFDIFMSLFNELEGLLRKVYVPQEGKSIMLMYINDIPEPYSSKMNTIRCARNVYVHGVKFDDEPLIFNRDKARIKDKNGKTIYKDEYELAKEIDALATQAKNIWEYLK